MQQSPKTLKLYRDVAKPFLASWLPFVCAFIITYPIRLWFRLKRFIRKIRHPEQLHPPLLALESGVRGWQIIEYKELYQSALEYVGEHSLVRFAVTDEAPYLTQLRDFLDKHPVTHYGWSPRTGDQHWFRCLVESLRVSILFSQRDIVPIVFLTDLLVRPWRSTAGIVTANSGIVVTLMSPKDVSLICPHRRFIGPYIMAFSQQTLDQLTVAREQVNQLNSARDAITLGALYEPRKTIVEDIRTRLGKTGHELIISGRTLLGTRSSDEDYWARMVNAKIVVTTSNVLEDSDEYDWNWKKHFVYRYMEVMACGSLLVAQALPGIDQYFTAGIHYVDYANEQDAAQKIKYYLEHDQEREQISQQGFARAKALVETRSFWSGIDMALAKEGLL